ncbi:MAG: SpoIIE family protein phosphatase [Phycisphaeraceae bacterium]|nr:SpoIIE family protein phosphatase [Phycisphaeraceae bacterium]
MQLDELRDNPRINLLVNTLVDLSRTRTPEEVLYIFTEAIAELETPRGYVSVSTRKLAHGQYKITRRRRHEESLDPRMNPWDRWHELPVCQGGVIGRIIATGRPVVIDHLSLDEDPALGDFAAGYRSLLALPLYDDGEPINWALFFFLTDRVEDSEDVEQSLLRANLVGSTIKQRVLVQELARANERIRGEMERIAMIQRALLPSRLPDIPGLSMAASYETFDEAGGDLYDLLPLARIGGDPDDPRWLIVIGDVSGHGPSAAVMMAMLQTLIHAYPGKPESPAALLEYANGQLLRKNVEQSFVTVFAAFYDPGTRHMVYARAGHNPPLLLHMARGELERLEAVGGLPLGIIDEPRLTDAQRVLEPGHTLVLYTDGITEARDPEGRWFGIEGIEASLHDCSGEPDCAIRHIRDSLRRFEQSVRPKDDQTLLAIRIQEKPETTQEEQVA